MIREGHIELCFQVLVELLDLWRYGCIAIFG